MSNLCFDDAFRDHGAWYVLNNGERRRALVNAIFIPRDGPNTTDLLVELTSYADQDDQNPVYPTFRGMPRKEYCLIQRHSVPYSQEPLPGTYHLREQEQPMSLGAMKPTMGRVVHYVLKDGQHRPAIIVRAWCEETRHPPQDAALVNLQVFLDGLNDGSETGLEWVTSADYDETGKTPYTWHWPEREGRPA